MGFSTATDAASLRPDAGQKAGAPSGDDVQPAEGFRGRGSGGL